MEKGKPVKKMRIKSLHHLLARNAAEFANHSLFKFERNGVDYDITYTEFYDYVKAIARGLIHLGLGGKRVAVIGETSVEWIGTYLGTVISGGEIVPLDALLDKEQLINFINLAECDAFFYSDSWAHAVESNLDKMPTVQYFGRLTDEEFSLRGSKQTEVAKLCRLSEIVKLGNTERAIAVPDTDTQKMCSLLFTSGTTGTSKGVMLSQRNICAVLEDVSVVLYQITDQDVLLSVLPIHHTYEMTAGILAPMIFGACICINDSIKHITKNLKKYRPTVMALVPLFLEQFDKKIRSSIAKQGKTRLVNVSSKASRALMRVGIDVRTRLFAQIREAFGGRLRYVISGAAALNPALVDFFRDLGITISQGYGITECAPLISVVPLDVYNPKSCGKVIPGMQVFIDKKHPTDPYGEIVVKGENVMLGYYNNPEATDEVLAKGWFYTGDYGYMDADGYLYITGRKKNVIVLPGGKNVFPEEVEEYLAPIDLIEECVVIGREKDGDVIVTAVVYPNATVAAERGIKREEDIQSMIKEEIRQVNQRLAVFKQIRRVDFRSEPFEKTSTRKIKRYKVV